MMAWRVLNPDFRPCVGDSDHRYLLIQGTYDLFMCHGR